MLPDLPAELASALADRYELRRTLGQGGMATVYQAYDRRHERDVALNVLLPGLAAQVGADRRRGLQCLAVDGPHDAAG